GCATWPPPRVPAVNGTGASRINQSGRGSPCTAGTEAVYAPTQFAASHELGGARCPRLGGRSRATEPGRTGGGGGGPAGPGGRRGRDAAVVGRQQPALRHTGGEEGR